MALPVIESLDKNWLKGIVYSENGELIARPNMALSELLETEVGKSGRYFHNNRHSRVEGFCFRSSGYSWEGGAYFLDSQMKVFLLYQPFLNATETAKVRVAIYVDIVRQKVGRLPPLGFEWGGIFSGIDPKGGDVDIRFHYE